MLWAEAGGAASYARQAQTRPRSGAGLPGRGCVLPRASEAAAASPAGRLHRDQRRRRLRQPVPERLRSLHPEPLRRHARPGRALGRLQTQWYWNTNMSADLRRQYWANAIGTGARAAVSLGLDARSRGSSRSTSFADGTRITDGQPLGPDIHRCARSASGVRVRSVNKAKGIWQKAPKWRARRPCKAGSRRAVIRIRGPDHRPGECTPQDPRLLSHRRSASPQRDSLWARITKRPRARNPAPTSFISSNLPRRSSVNRVAG